MRYIETDTIELGTVTRDWYRMADGSVIAIVNGGEQVLDSDGVPLTDQHRIDSILDCALIAEYL